MSRNGRDRPRQGTESRVEPIPADDHGSEGAMSKGDGRKRPERAKGEGKGAAGGPVGPVRQVREWLDARMDGLGRPDGAKPIADPEQRQPDAESLERSEVRVGSAEERAAARAHYRMLADVGTTLWYLKTRHFGKAWSDDSLELDDAREQRGLRRLSKGLEALASGGIEIVDPVGRRYPPGAEAMMKPVQLTPRTGISKPRVTETVRPIVYLRGRLLQRAEVFIDVPLEDEDGPSTAPETEVSEPGQTHGEADDVKTDPEPDAEEA